MPVGMNSWSNPRVEFPVAYFPCRTNGSIASSDGADCPRLRTEWPASTSHSHPVAQLQEESAFPPALAAPVGTKYISLPRRSMRLEQRRTRRLACVFVITTLGWFATNACLNAQQEGNIDPAELDNGARVFMLHLQCLPRAGWQSDQRGGSQIWSLPTRIQ